MIDRIRVKHCKNGGLSPYRLYDGNGIEVTEVNNYLDSVIIRGLSERGVRTYAYDALNFWSWLKESGTELGKVTGKLLLRYIQYQKTGASPAPATINRRLVVANCIYMYHFNKPIPDRKNQDPAQEKKSRFKAGWLHPIGIRRSSIRVKVPRKLVRPLSGREAAEFFNSLRTWRDMAICGFMLQCGLRIREVAILRMEDVSMEESQVRVLGKGNKERMVPLPDTLIKLLNKYIALERPETDNNSLFIVLKGPRRGRGLTLEGMHMIFRYHRKVSGIRRANPHRFRHTFGVNMARAGISMVALKRLMGHSQIQMTLQYVNFSADDIRTDFNRAISRLGYKEFIDDSKIRF